MRAIMKFKEDQYESFESEIDRFNSEVLEKRYNSISNVEAKKQLEY